MGKQALRLEHLRAERDLTQEQLAILAGINPETISRIERGVGRPRLRTLHRLARALRVEV
ncbi:MAG: helix-turn-helix transcriptional regulator, partial [Actinomycetota bacterium]